jgi:hypothetical protein
MFGVKVGIGFTQNLSARGEKLGGLIERGTRLNYPRSCCVLEDVRGNTFKASTLRCCCKPFLDVTNTRTMIVENVAKVATTTASPLEMTE